MTTTISADLSDSLDKSYGDNGEVNLNRLFSLSTDYYNAPYSAILLNDNSSIISIDARVSSTLIKLDHNGSPVTEFGGNGTGLFREDYSRESYGDAAIVSVTPLCLLSAGDKIVSLVMCRSANSQFIPGCGRYLRDGSPDITFNGTGKKVLSELASAQDVAAEQPRPDALRQVTGPIEVRPTLSAHISDEKITFVCSYGRFSYLVRLNTDGMLDETFNGNGFTTIAYKGTTMDISSLTRYDDSHWILTGAVPAVGDLPTIGVVAKVDDQGKLDVRFGEQGFVRVSGAEQNSSKVFNALVVADQSLWIACALSAGTEFTDQPRVLRIDRDGDRDTAFEKGPMFDHTLLKDMNIAATPTAGERWVTATYFGGPIGATGGMFASIGRLLPDGSADSSFGSQGYLYPPEIQSLDVVAVQNDGNCLVVGVDYIDGLVSRVPTMVRRFKATDADASAARITGASD